MRRGNGTITLPVQGVSACRPATDQPGPRRTVAHGLGATPERVQGARWRRKQRGPQLLLLRDRDVGAGAALRSGAQTAPPSSVSGSAPWHRLLQRVGASNRPLAPWRQFTRHVDLRDANFGCGSSLPPSWTHLRPSRPSCVRGRVWSSLVGAGRSGFWVSARKFAGLWAPYAADFGLRPHRTRRTPYSAYLLGTAHTWCANHWIF